MNLQMDIDVLLNKDIDDVIAWGQGVSDGHRDAYDYAAKVVSSRQTPPVKKIKALALMQVIVGQNLDLLQSDLSDHANILMEEIERTDNAEVQFDCARVLAEILADCPKISDELFRSSADLLKCLERTCVYPHSREFLRGVFSKGTPLRERYRERMMMIGPPVLGVIGKLATESKRESRELAKRFGIDYVSFGEFIKKEAERQGIETSPSQLQALGQRLVDRDPVALCRNVLSQAPDWEPGFPIVIDGIRHTRVLQALEPMVAPRRICILIHEVEPGIRNRLLAERIPDEAARAAAVDDRTEVEIPALSKGAIPFGAFMPRVKAA